MCVCACVCSRSFSTFWHVAHRCRRRRPCVCCTVADKRCQFLINKFRTLLPCLVPVVASTFVLCGIKHVRKKCSLRLSSLHSCTKVCTHTHYSACVRVCTHLSIVQRLRPRMPPQAELVSFSRSGRAAFELCVRVREFVCVSVSVQYGACFNVTTFQFPKTTTLQQNW